VSLESGQILQHYRLADKVGQGGMGEVWRAIDTTLDREVAIKLLPAAFAGDRERVLRQEREAKLLASLNHPNIAAIYGFHAVGQERFLAMELVPGEDLAQILARRPLPIREALDAARQIAAALEAAHDAGVIHRDLKPANVKRTPDGRIKVLDFGLAKAAGPGGVDRGSSATLTSDGSTAGLIVGTASYMSPEQARGQPVDRRTDLWAFGCVLYEMLTGVKAFDGSTVTDVLAAIVGSEPDWDKLPAATPISVRRLLRRCLEKDARKRLRDAGDASLLLDDGPEDVQPSSPRARPAWAGPIVVGLAAAVAGLAAGWWIADRAGAGRSGIAGETGAAALAFHRVTYERGMMRAARFSPDGRTIVYGAAWGGPPIHLYLARTDTPEAAPISLPPAELLSISRQGEMAVALDYAFYGWMARGKLARTSLLGGAPREILENVRAADWSPDGTQFAVARWIDGRDRLEYPVGNVLDQTIGYFADVRVSPDGEHVAYTDHPTWGDNRGNVAVIDRSGKKTTLAADFSAVQGVAWSPDGREVWHTAIRGQEGWKLYATDLTGRTRVVYASAGGIELFDIAADGRVLMASQQSQREGLALLAGFPEPRPVVVPGESSEVRGITADGRAVLVANQAGQDYETFVVRSDQSGAVRLSAGDAVGLSPDGRWAMSVSADYRTFFVSPLGTGATRKIPNPDGVEYVSLGNWHPDGRRFVIVGRRGTEPSRGFACDVETGACAPFGDPGMMWPLFVPPPVSPDGRYVVLQDAHGTPLRWPIAGGTALPIPGSLAEDQQLVFTEDGAGLFVCGRSVPVVIERIELATGRRTPWSTVAPSDRAGLRYSIATITPDGRHWALSTSKLLSALYVVEGLR
jgi:Tol biopolymer transport system component